MPESRVAALLEQLDRVESGHALRRQCSSSNGASTTKPSISDGETTSSSNSKSSTCKPNEAESPKQPVCIVAGMRIAKAGTTQGALIAAGYSRHLATGGITKRPPKSVGKRTSALSNESVLQSMRDIDHPPQRGMCVDSDRPVLAAPDPAADAAAAHKADQLERFNTAQAARHAGHISFTLDSFASHAGAQASEPAEQLTTISSEVQARRKQEQEDRRTSRAQSRRKLQRELTTSPHSVPAQRPRTASRAALTHSATQRLRKRLTALIHLPS